MSRFIGSCLVAMLPLLAVGQKEATLDRPKGRTSAFEVVPNNLDARISHNVPEFEREFPQRGATVAVAIFDEGRILGSHQEFQKNGVSRVVAKTAKPTARHSTHCAGTVGAVGVKPIAVGMATMVKIFSYDWDNDAQKLQNDADNFQVSSHSYGPLSGWVRGFPKAGIWNWWGGLNANEDSRYGKYTDDCSQFDEVLFRKPNVTTFLAAGNDRGNAPLNQPTTHFVVETNSFSAKVRPRIGGATGLDSISGTGLAKNAICIGAVNDIPQGAGANAIRITSFSGVGPADDGRIKPDLVANGFQLVSTSNASNTAYVEMSGTSMATPTAAGIAALLCELYKDTNSRAVTSAEIKATLIHTARDGGVAGPDPQYGWGSIDALAAGKLIQGTQGKLIDDPSKNRISTNETKTYKMAATGEPIRVTIVWTDPTAAANLGGVDDATPMLQNDLDVRIISPAGTVFQPYSLDLANLWNATTNLPHQARKDRPNRVDNVEVVDAPSAAGEWKIEVKAFQLKVGEKQSFALAVTGLK